MTDDEKFLAQWLGQRLADDLDAFGKIVKRWTDAYEKAHPDVHDGDQGIPIVWERDI